MHSSSSPSSRIPVAVGTVALAASLTCLSLTGCTTTPDEPETPSVTTTTTDVAPLDERTSSAGATDMTVDTSTALVVYVHDDDIAFVNQETGTLYLPTIPEDVYGLNGARIDEDQLVVGNVVSVTGNGIMLESYPGQYPGISKIEVIDQGNPADADKYADEAHKIFQGADPSQIPTASVEYTTGLGQVGLPLTAYSYEWNGAEGGVEDIATATGSVIEAGEFHAEDGTLREGITDTRLDAPVEATLTVSTDTRSIEVERQPVIQNPQGAWALNEAAHSEKVLVRTASATKATFTIEPGYAYEIDLDFGGDNDASYVFYAVS